MTGSQWAERIAELLSGDVEILEAYVLLVEATVANRRRKRRATQVSRK